MNKNNNNDKYKFIEKNFYNLRNQICSEFEAIENESKTNPNINLKPGKFKRKKWKRKADKGYSSGGGGEMSIMYGKVFEKVGVNISTVMGSFTEEMKNKIPGAKNNPNFYATGISLVAHMHSPFIPAAHFNTRFIRTTKNWFGGGADLTPMLHSKRNSNDTDTILFHESMRKACQEYPFAKYKEFKANCDKYFFIKHRKENRGTGGIFFDRFKSEQTSSDFLFLNDVGNNFIKTYKQIILSNMSKEWNDNHRMDVLEST